MFKRLLLTLAAAFALSQALQAQSAFRDYSNIYVDLADFYNLQTLQQAIPTATASASAAYYHATYANIFAAGREVAAGAGNMTLADTYDQLIYVFCYYAYIYSQDAYLQTLTGGFNSTLSFAAYIYSYLAYIYSVYAFYE
jgi:hypothetical protein